MIFNIEIILFIQFKIKSVNELRRFCKVCDNLIEVLEGYEQKIKTDFETIDCFKYFLDEVIFLKQEIENFIEKPSSFEQINRIGE